MEGWSISLDSSGTDPAPFVGRRVAVAGPEPRTPRERVDSLARVLSRPLTALDLPLDVVADRLNGFGLPPWQVGGLLELFELYASGAAVGVDPTVEAVLGRPVTRWDSFAYDHRARFDAG